MQSQKSVLHNFLLCNLKSCSSVGFRSTDRVQQLLCRFPLISDRTIFQTYDHTRTIDSLPSTVVETWCLVSMLNHNLSIRQVGCIVNNHNVQQREEGRVKVEGGSFISQGKIALRSKLVGLLSHVTTKKRTVWNTWPLVTEEDVKVLERTDNMSRVLAEDIIGKFSSFSGPYGIRSCLYVDTTASGKPLGIIEEFINDRVLPYYANTHTEVSHTSHVTSSYRAEAREILREAVGAEEDDVVIFYGSGSTGAVHKLVHSLAIEKAPPEQKPVVLIGPYEHHSNILPWRETGASVLNIPENSTGGMDIKALKRTLKGLSCSPEYKGRPIYASFSAGSNVTGRVMDDVRITMLIHEFGGLCFWDYAAAAPHVQIEMNPKVGSYRETKLARKDAIFFSGHKFLGGPQTSGILVAKAHVFKNSVPHGSGGGTVFFVTPQRHAYLQSREDIEEGGTPGILQSIRLGLVFSLHESIGIQNLIAREAYFTRKVLEAWSSTRGLIILGNKLQPRLPIISFLIEHLESGFYLHHNFVVALLNDLFGIQCRGGCMCAGPYAQTLLGIDEAMSRRYEKALSKDINECRFFGKDPETEPVYLMIYRPGFTRISLPFETSEAEINFIIEAVKIIAADGWKLLPLYSVDSETGTFKHRAKRSQDINAACSLRDFHAHKASNFSTDEDRSPTEDSLLRDFSGILRQVTAVISATYQLIPSQSMKQIQTEGELHIKSIPDNLRWFMLPTDAFAYLNPGRSKQKPKCKRLFNPPRYDNLFNQFTSQLSSTDSIPYAKNSIPYQLTQTIV